MMSPDAADRQPTFWMNVTTSSQWTRSPVGIVRTEQEILKQLRDKLQHRLKTVVFDQGEWVPQGREHKDRGTLAEMWPEPSYGASTDPFDVLQPPRFNQVEVVKPSVVAKFRHGDVFITLGLDWDHPGLHEKIGELRTRYGLTVITCCYDLIPVLYPQYCVSDVAAWFKTYLIDMAWSSDGILCISNATRRDYLDFAREVGLPDRRTEVIRLGSSIPKRNAVDEPSAEVKPLIGQRFFLFVSTIERRKNHEVLYRAYHLIRKQRPEIRLPKLVFVGMQGWGVQELMSDIALDPLISDEVVVLSHVSDSDLSLPYDRCEAVLFPSLYEGWGLPIAEALQAGRPVIASDTGSIPEVGGDLVRYVDPWVPRDWARELLRVIENPEDTAVWAERIAHNFKPYEWSDAADSLIALASELHGQRPEEMRLEPGYDLSSLHGMHYGEKVIYDGASGIICHGPYIGAPPGRHRVSIELTWLGGTGEFLRFIVAYELGKTRAAVRRLELADLNPGRQMVDLDFTLLQDVTDLEFVCEAHSQDRIKLSIDQIHLKLNVTSAELSAPVNPVAELVSTGA